MAYESGYLEALDDVKKLNDEAIEFEQIPMIADNIPSAKPMGEWSTGWYCGQCGRKFTDGIGNYCQACGTKVIRR